MKVVAAEGEEDEGRCGRRRRRRRQRRRKEKKAKVGAAVVRGKKERRWYCHCAVFENYSVVPSHCVIQLNI
ncbi:hypothetical protein Q3G72_000433 [Acer saccharum]|nr:hypothetical protein Q3G72_000433 [Acer saccharum]